MISLLLLKPQIALVTLRNTADFTEHQPAVFLHFVAQTHRLNMVAAEPAGDFRFDLRGFEIFLAQIVCNRALENVGDDGVDIVCGKDMFDALYPSS